MSMNLRHMGFNEALDAAKQRSGLTNEAIANRSSLSTAAVSRYFNKYDDYTPSPELIPLLCRALGNTIIADWIAAQVEDMHPATNITTTEDLTRAVMQATENTGILNKKTLDAVADGELSPSEAATIQAQFRANAKWNNEAADALDPLADKSIATDTALWPSPYWTGAPDERVANFSEQGVRGRARGRVRR